MHNGSITHYLPWIYWNLDTLNGALHPMDPIHFPMEYIWSVDIDECCSIIYSIAPSDDAIGSCGSILSIGIQRKHQMELSNPKDPLNVGSSNEMENGSATRWGQLIQ